MSGPRIILVASDPGSARVLVPVGRELASSGASLVAFASGPAARIFSEDLAGIPVNSVADDASEAQVAVWLQEVGAHALAVGAGAYHMLEHRARLSARTLALPTVAVLDYWFEYAARFHRQGASGRVASWPDLVCVPDDSARVGLVAAGCAPASIVVTGSPNLEASLRSWRDRPPTSREALAASFGVDPGGRLVLFLSEPYRRQPDGALLTGPGGVWRDDATPLFGYTPDTILDHLIEAIAAAAAGRPVTLLLKVHPLEWPAPFAALAEKARGHGLHAVVIEWGSVMDLVALADVVTGMSSIALVEAALVGRPSLSVQIGLGPDAPFDPCIGNALGLTTSILDRAALNDAARAIMAGTLNGAAGPTPAFVDGASRRVADLVLARAAA